MSRIIREARPTDMAEIMQVMDAAKKIMRQFGNVHQWGEGYPSEAVIAADMERNGGFVIEEDAIRSLATLLFYSPQNRHMPKSMMANGLMIRYLIM